jgi:protein involved in polysaccharide export with SLBB domain
MFRFANAISLTRACMTAVTVALVVSGSSPAYARDAKSIRKASNLARVLSSDNLRNPHVVVLNHRPFYVMGEVTRPGSYPYVSGMTMINAIALAGGFTYRADEDSFDLMRPGKSGKKSKVDAKAETPVKPGDVITVNERIF